MTGKDLQQKNRQQRGEDFQDEIRRSWSYVPGSWRIRIPDGGGASRPADNIVLTQDVNILEELKRTAGDAFTLNMLRKSQVRGLVDFDAVIKRSYGLVYVSFLNTKEDRDEAYAFRLTTALRYMHGTGKRGINLGQLQSGNMPSIALKLLDEPERTYDLKEVSRCYKYL